MFLTSLKASTITLPNSSHSEVQNTDCVVGKTCSDLVTFFIPTYFKYATVAGVCLHNLSFLQGPNVHGFIKRSTGQILPIRAKCNWVHGFPDYTMTIFCQNILQSHNHIFIIKRKQFLVSIHLIIHQRLIGIRNSQYARRDLKVYCFRQEIWK